MTVLNFPDARTTAVYSDDSPVLAVLIDEAHDLGSRGSSSREKKLAAAFRFLVGPPVDLVAVLGDRFPDHAHRPFPQLGRVALRGRLLGSRHGSILQGLEPPSNPG
jgi:hypothetical protein